MDRGTALKACSFPEQVEEDTEEESFNQVYIKGQLRWRW